MRFLVVAALLLCLLAAAPRAQGAKVISRDGRLSASAPALSGGDGTVSWVSGRRVRTATPAGSRTVLRLPAHPALEHIRDVFSVAELDGSPDGRLGIANQVFRPRSSRYDFGDYYGAELFLGTAAGPIARVGGCVAGESDCVPETCAPRIGLIDRGAIELDRPPSAPNQECSGGPEAALYLRTADGDRTLLQNGASPVPVTGRLQTAGQYIAYGRPHTESCLENVAVRRVADDRPLFEGCADGFSLTAEGALATVNKGILTWRNVNNPRPRTIAVRATEGIVAAGNRVAMWTGRSGGIVVVSTTGRRWPIARFNGSWHPLSGFDFDGTYVAWTESRCGRPFVMRARVGSPRRPPRLCGARPTNPADPVRAVE